MLLTSAPTPLVLQTALLFSLARSHHASAQNADAAACGAACISYLDELKTNYQLSHYGVDVIGSQLSKAPETIKGMCDLAGTSIQTCYECSPSSSNGLSGDAQLLMEAWWETCVTFNDVGYDLDKTYACWLSVPQGSGSCARVAAGLGGSGGGDTGGGGDGGGSTGNADGSGGGSSTQNGAASSAASSPSSDTTAVSGDQSSTTTAAGGTATSTDQAATQNSAAPIPRRCSFWTSIAFIGVVAFATSALVVPN